MHSHLASHMSNTGLVKQKNPNSKYLGRKGELIRSHDEDS